jgi:hypothetical protein
MGASRLRVTVPARVAPERAARVLGPERPAWLGDDVEDTDGVPRYLLNLELRVSDLAPRVTFHKAAYVVVGPLQHEGGGQPPSVEISWRAAGLAPLFPVFAGRLSWVDGELRLDGYYAPPGGTMGQVADRLLLNVAARATARRLLERIAEVMAPKDGGG